MKRRNTIFQYVEYYVDHRSGQSIWTQLYISKKARKNKGDRYSNITRVNNYWNETETWAEIDELDSKRRERIREGKLINVLGESKKQKSFFFSPATRAWREIEKEGTQKPVRRAHLSFSSIGHEVR